MSPAPVSSANQIKTNIIEVSRVNPAVKGIVMGEILPVTVLEKLSGNKYLLALKDLQIPSTSEVSLKYGEKILVKVTGLQPQIVLSIVDTPEQNRATAVNEKLLQWRANPEALLQMIVKASEFVKLLKSEGLPIRLSSKDIGKLISLFDDIIFSPRTKNNPLFLKEFVSKTGILLENTLKQLVAEATRGIMEKPLEDNLKTLLLKISSAVREALQNSSKLDPQMAAKLTNLSAFTVEALQTIEARQAINTVFQDSDNGLVLQVPVAVADSFRLADIFIVPEDKDGQSKQKFSSCSVAIFLDLDVLGKITVNVSIKEGSCSCVIKCAEEKSRDLISAKLDELKTSLVETGYRVDYVDCIQEEGLMRQREEFLAGQSFSNVDIVNFFI
jgi:hypothetical protein